MRPPQPSAETYPAAGSRYTSTAQVLHWLTVVLVLAVLPLAWVMVSLPRDASYRPVLITLHKSVGLTIFAVIVLRLLWRAAHHAPLLRYLSRWQMTAVFASHWLLYLTFVLMPISGYVLSTAGGGNPVNFFWLFTIPGLPKNKAVGDAATWLHVGLGQWIVYALVLLHIAATVWHIAVRRDGVLERMLPKQKWTDW